MSVDEGQVDRAGPEGIEYGAVSSCMTVTCLIDDGSHVGGHLSLAIPDDSRFDSAQVLSAMYSLIGNRKVVRIHLAGMPDTWNPSYLSEPLLVGFGQSAALNEDVYTGQLDADDLAPAICAAFGVDPSACTQEEREGAFTITLTSDGGEATDDGGDSPDDSRTAVPVDDRAAGKDPEPYEFYSPVWKGGHTQETEGWCYAATEKTIQEAFGGPSLEQAEIAHDALMQRGEIDDSVSAHRYYTFVKGLNDAGTIPDRSWASAGPNLDKAMSDLHQTLYGDLLLKGRTFEYTSKPQAEILLDTMLRDGLVAFGDENHWRMIHGYYVEDANDLSQGVSFLVFDPETGEDDWATYDAIVAAMHDTRLVRG